MRPKQMTLENEPGVRHGSPVEGGHMRYFFITTINAMTKRIWLMVPEG